MSAQRLSFFIVFSGSLYFSIAYAGKTVPFYSKRLEAKHTPVAITKPKPFLGKVTHSFQGSSHFLSSRSKSREVLVYIETIQFRNVRPNAFHSDNSSNFSHGSVSYNSFLFRKRYHKFRKHHHHRKHVHHGNHSNSGRGTSPGGDSNSGGTSNRWS